MNADPRGRLDPDRDVAGTAGLRSARGVLAFAVFLRGRAGAFAAALAAAGLVAALADFGFLVFFAGLAGVSMAPQASVTAEIVARRSFRVAFARVRLNGASIGPQI